jgi:hypothetical protein
MMSAVAQSTTVMKIAGAMMMALNVVAMMVCLADVMPV